MPLNLLQYRIEISEDRTAYYVGVKYRLHEHGSDYMLYANHNFNSGDQTQSPFLVALLALLKRNNSGVTCASIEPFSIKMFGASALTLADVQQLVENAARVAGLKPRRI